MVVRCVCAGGGGGTASPGIRPQCLDLLAPASDREKFSFGYRGTHMPNIGLCGRGGVQGLTEATAKGAPFVSRYKVARVQNPPAEIKH
jgi:hypothetical protein